MHRDHFKQMLCLPCAVPVQRCLILGDEYVRCERCNHVDTIEKARDDCFVFIVAMGMSETTLRFYAAHHGMYMPLLEEQPAAMRDRMVSAGRIKIARAA